jgi:hypothetical protein
MRAAGEALWRKCGGESLLLFAAFERILWCADRQAGRGFHLSTFRLNVIHLLRD